MTRALTALMLGAVATVALAAADGPTRTLTVTGTGQVSVSPDICYMEFGAETSSPQSASAAYKANSDAMNAMIQALKAAGIPTKDIQTTRLFLRPRYMDPRTGKRDLSEYSVEQSVSVKVRDLSKVSAVLDAAVVAGANSIGSVEFTVEDARKYTQDARTEALRNAKAKAERIALDAGVKLGKPMTIVEGGSAYGYRDRVGGVRPTGEGVGPQGGAAGSELEAGETKLTQSMTVTYELE